jgi:hypothetical protein
VLAASSAFLFGAMTVAIRFGLRNGAAPEVGTVSTVITALVVIRRAAVRPAVSPLIATESLWGVALSALMLHRNELVGRRLAAGAALVVAGGALIGACR